MANMEKIALTIVQETAYTKLPVTNTREHAIAAAVDIWVLSVTQVSQLVPYNRSSYIAQPKLFQWQLLCFLPNPAVRKKSQGSFLFKEHQFNFIHKKQILRIDYFCETKTL